MSGVVHGFNNLKPANAKALAVVTPALIGPDYFREMAAIVNAGGPPDLAKTSEEKLQPQRGCGRHRACGRRIRNGRNRVAVGEVGWTMTQGSSSLATLGFGTESRWDSRMAEVNV